MLTHAGTDSWSAISGDLQPIALLVVPLLSACGALSQLVDNPTPPDADIRRHRLAA